MCSSRIIFNASGESMSTQCSTSNMPDPSLEACEPRREKSQFSRLLFANWAQFVWLPLMMAASSWYRYVEIRSQLWPVSSPARKLARKPCEVIMLILSMASSIRLSTPSSWNKSWRFLKARKRFCFSSCSVGIRRDNK